MKTKIQVLAVIALVALAGCGGNIKDWAEETFYQSNAYKDDKKVIKRYLRGMRLYDQFTTLGIFDALWLSDEVRTLYANIACRITGKDEETTLSFLKRQISANSFYIAFYVLTLHDSSLIATPPLWTMYLEIDGKKYIPSEIKTVELPFEYIDFFGSRMSKHKQPYEVKFDRKDMQDQDILKDKKVMKLFFSTPCHYDSMVWYLDAAGNATSELAKTSPALVDKSYKKEKNKTRVKPQNEFIETDVTNAEL